VQRLAAGSASGAGGHWRSAHAARPWSRATTGVARSTTAAIHHQHPERNPELAEIYLRVSEPARLIMSRSRYQVS
jgi:hypothetical protein